MKRSPDDQHEWCDSLDETDPDSVSNHYYRVCLNAGCGWSLYECGTSPGQRDPHPVPPLECIGHGKHLRGAVYTKVRPLFNESGALEVIPIRIDSTDIDDA